MIGEAHIVDTESPPLLEHTGCESGVQHPGGYILHFDVGREMQLAVLIQGSFQNFPAIRPEIAGRIVKRVFVVSGKPGSGSSKSQLNVRFQVAR